ncbi:unnamed protein product [Trichogramma brassicae]|uniref:Uncharacterized protein n=1 Tax=Trichogramma brassicae TaxID=86971 RepID=A0A6H5I7N4_9HYME|nr:unnamed protein product [Trichogramma brassicae]
MLCVCVCCENLTAATGAAATGSVSIIGKTERARYTASYTHIFLYTKGTQGHVRELARNKTAATAAAVAGLLYILFAIFERKAQTQYGVRAYIYRPKALTDAARNAKAPGSISRFCAAFIIYDDGDVHLIVEETHYNCMAIAARTSVESPEWLLSFRDLSKYLRGRLKVVACHARTDSDNPASLRRKLIDSARGYGQAQCCIFTRHRIRGKNYRADKTCRCPLHEFIFVTLHTLCEEERRGGTTRRINTLRYYDARLYGISGVCMASTCVYTDIARNLFAFSVVDSENQGMRHLVATYFILCFLCCCTRRFTTTCIGHISVLTAKKKKFPSRTRFMYTHASTMLTARSDTTTTTTTTTSPPRARTGRRERKKKEKKRKRERGSTFAEKGEKEETLAVGISRVDRNPRSERVITCMYTRRDEINFSWRSENSSNFVYTESSRSGTRGVSGVGGDAAAALASASRAYSSSITCFIRRRSVVCDYMEQTIQLDAQDNLGNSALHSAIHCGNVDMVEFLLLKGANPNVANNDGMTPLHIIRLKRAVRDHLLMTFLRICDHMQQTLQLDAQDKLGNTPLHLAVLDGCLVMIEPLLRRGANPNLTNQEGTTPLHIICKKGTDAHIYAMNFFRVCDNVYRTVHVDVRDKFERTPLEWAVANRLHLVVDILLDNGANLRNFIFPFPRHYDEHLKPKSDENINSFRSRLVKDALAVVKRLEKKGWKLQEHDKLKVMSIIRRYGLLKKSSEKFEESRRDAHVVQTCYVHGVRPHILVFYIYIRRARAEQCMDPLSEKKNLTKKNSNDQSGACRIDASRAGLIVRDYETAARCSALQMCGSPRDRNIARRDCIIYKSSAWHDRERERERPATIEKRGLGAFPRPARAVRARSRLQFARSPGPHYVLL